MIKEGKNNSKIFFEIDTFGPKSRSALQHTANQVSVELVKKSRDMVLDPNKTGRIYRWHGTKHQASAAGEAPANRSGTLLNSIQAKTNGTTIVFGADAPYAKYLEMGTKNEDGTNKMAARPYLEPSIEHVRSIVQQLFYSYLK